MEDRKIMCPMTRRRASQSRDLVALVLCLLASGCMVLSSSGDNGEQNAQWMDQENSHIPAAYDLNEPASAPAYYLQTSGYADDARADSPVLAPIRPAASPFAPFMFPTFPTSPPRPKSPPTVKEPTEPRSCYSDINTLNIDERNAVDLDVVRDYVLCANTIFETSIIDSGDPSLEPLTVRKNMHIYCGEIGGSSDNNCTLTYGTLLVSFRGNFDIDVYNENVLIQGVTFRDTYQFAVLIGLAGAYQFIDCIFTDHRNSIEIPIRIQGESPEDRKLDSIPGRYNYSPLDKRAYRETWMRERDNRDLQSSDAVSVEFVDCVFEGCSGSYALMDLIGGIDAKFSNTLFQNNNYNVLGVNDEPGFEYGVIIEKLGVGLFELSSTCFVNNRAIGNALVLYYKDAIPTFSNNFGVDNAIVYTTDLECEFVAQVDIETDTFESVACADFDADQCAVGTQPPSTFAPVISPPSFPVGPTLEPEPPVVSPSTPSPVVVPTDTMPTMTDSRDMPSITDSKDMPTIAEPTKVPEPSQSPIDAPVLMYTPAFTPSMFTPSIEFPPALYAPLNFPVNGPPVAAPIAAPTVEQPVAYPAAVPIYVPVESPVATPVGVLVDEFDESTDSTECDICPNSPIVNNRKVVRITIPGTTETETATCEEWFATGCALVDAEYCADFQNLLAECCTADSSTMETVQKGVSIEPFAVKFVGDFELKEGVTVQIIHAVNELMAPYLMGELGQVLDNIDLQMAFMEEESINLTAASSGGQRSRALQSSTTALIEVSGKLDLEASNEESLSEWTSQRITEVVAGFFTSSDLEKLYRTLKDSNLDIQEIEMHDGNTDAIVTDEGTTTQTTNDNGGNEGSSTNMKALIAAAIGGGFVCLVLAIAMFVSSRRQRKRFRSVRGVHSISDTETHINLRSGKDRLPDCNTSAAGSHVSFPDVFSSNKDKAAMDRANKSESFSRLPVDDIDDLLDEILADDASLEAVKVEKKKKRQKKKRRSHRQEDDLEKAMSWARRTRTKHSGVPLSAPQPYDRDQDLY